MSTLIDFEFESRKMVMEVGGFAVVVESTEPESCVLLEALGLRIPLRFRAHRVLAVSQV